MKPLTAAVLFTVLVAAPALAGTLNIVTKYPPDALLAPSANCLTTYNAGSYPKSVAVGDFNGDGHLDLVVANQFDPGHGVSVLLGTVNGSFGAATAYDAGAGPVSVAVGDFNGDGHLDLAVVNLRGSYGPTPRSDTVSALLGTGTGAFGPAAAYSVGMDTSPVSVAVGDFNGDGHLDLVVANLFDNTVSVLLGTGNGSFGGATAYNAGAEPVSVAAGDFNGDGHLDLVVGNSGDNTVSVLLGTGNGSFGGATAYNAGAGPVSVAVGDFNGDDHPDLVVANSGDNTVSVLLGTGSGLFSADTAYQVGRGPVSVAAGDFDGDGHLDLAVANSGDNSVSVLLGVNACGPVTRRSGCVGDCNNDGAVAIDELLTLVNIALGNAPLGACPAAGSWGLDCGDASCITVPLIIRAVSNALNDCATCPPGTCRLYPDDTCERPTGPLGNACCQCSYDGWCTFYCICASPDTPIATPSGEVPMSSLKVGDLVYSINAWGIVAVPLLKTNRVAVHSHHVVQVRLATGGVLEISAGHPTADGRIFGELRPGDTLGDVEIVAVQVIPYVHDYTYDILPASESGVYFAAGVPVGSTLHPRPFSYAPPTICGVGPRIGPQDFPRPASHRN